MNSQAMKRLRNLKCILVSAGSQSEKAMYCVISTMTSWKKQNYGDSKEINGCQRLGSREEEETNRWSTENFQGSENILFDSIMMDTCHYTSVQIHRMYNTKSEYIIRYVLCVIMIYQCRISNFFFFLGSAILKNVPFWWGMMIMGECMHVWGRGYMGNLYTSPSILLCTQNFSKK